MIEFFFPIFSVKVIGWKSIFFNLVLVKLCFFNTYTYNTCSEMDRTWMYNGRRIDAYFRGVLNKFIKVVKDHTRNEKTQLIHCPCKVCRNLKVYNDPVTIRSHLVVSGFVMEYKIWKYQGELDAPPPTNNPLDEFMQDDEAVECLMLI